MQGGKSLHFKEISLYLLPSFHSRLACEQGLICIADRKPSPIFPRSRHSAGSERCREKRWSQALHPKTPKSTGRQSSIHLQSHCLGQKWAWTGTEGDKGMHLMQIWKEEGRLLKQASESSLEKALGEVGRDGRGGTEHSTQEATSQSRGCPACGYKNVLETQQQCLASI